MKQAWPVKLREMVYAEATRGRFLISLRLHISLSKNNVSQYDMLIFTSLTATYILPAMHVFLFI